MIPSASWRYGNFTPFVLMFGSYVFQINTSEVLKVISIALNNPRADENLFYMRLNVLFSQGYSEGACETTFIIVVLF